MAPKESITRVLSSDSDLFIDGKTATAFKFVSKERIGELLGTVPNNCWVVAKLGLCEALSISYRKPDWEVVKDFVLKFNKDEEGCQFRGQFVSFNMDTLRGAFKLPKGDADWNVKKWFGPELKKYFDKERNDGGKYCLDWLAPHYKHLEGPMRVVCELLLARRRPSCVTGRIMWYFDQFLQARGIAVKPGRKSKARKPDWARLMHDEIIVELLAFKAHLIKGREGLVKNQACFIGTAIFRILRWYELGRRPSFYKNLSPSTKTKNDQCVGPAANTKRSQRRSREQQELTSIQSPVPTKRKTRSDTELKYLKLAERAKKAQKCHVNNAQIPSTSRRVEATGGTEGDAQIKYNGAPRIVVECLDDSDAEDVDTPGSRCHTFEEPDVHYQFEFEDPDDAHLNPLARTENLQPATSPEVHRGGAVEDMGTRMETPDFGCSKVVERASTFLHLYNTQPEDTMDVCKETIPDQIHRDTGAIRVDLAMADSNHVEISMPLAEDSIKQLATLTSLISTMKTSIAHGKETQAIFYANLERKVSSLSIQLEKTAGIQDGSESLRGELGLSQSENHRLEALTESRNIELMELQKQSNENIVKLQAELETQSREKEAHLQTNTEQEQSIRELRRQIESQASVMAETETLKQQAKHDESIIFDLRAKLKEMPSKDERLTSLLQQVGEKDATILKMQGELESLSNERSLEEKQLQTEISSLKLQLEILKRKFDEQEAANQSNQSSLQRITFERDSQITELQVLLSSTKSAQTNAESQKKAANDKLEDFNLKRLAEVQKAESDMKILDREKDQLKMEMQKATGELARRAAEIETLKASLAETKSLNASLEKQAEAHNMRHVELQSAQAELREAREKVAESDILAKNTMSIRNAASKEVSSLQDTLQRVRHNFAIQGTELHRQNRVLFDTEKQLKTLQAEHEKLIEKEKETNAKYEKTKMQGEAGPSETIAPSGIDHQQALLRGTVAAGGTNRTHNRTAPTHTPQTSHFTGTRTGAVSSHTDARSTGDTQIQPPRRQIVSLGDSSDDDSTPMGNYNWNSGPIEPPPKIDGSDLVAEAEPPPGQLLVKPKEHQKKGLAWMMNRESEGSGRARGGILADDQGMGKTLQAIMLILTERPKGSCTLVVGPVAVLGQWKAEIETKCSPGAEIRCLLYYGPDRNKSPPNFAKYSVVVTSYPTLECEWKNHRATKGEPSPIYTMHWHRVILDEAQVIKNNKTNAANAVCALASNTRWCLTGTPLQNCVGDLYSFFRFLQHNTMSDPKQFKALKDKCSKNYKLGMLSLRTHLSYITLRRMKDILCLPEKKVRDITIDFLEKRHRDLYQSFMDKGTELWMECKKRGGTHTGQTLALLMKSRQACVHPALTEVIKTAGQGSERRWTRKDHNELEKVVNSINLDSKCQICENDLLDGAYISVTCKHLFCNDCASAALDDSEGLSCPVQGCKKKAQLISIDEITGDMGVSKSQGFDNMTTSSKMNAVLEYIRELPPKTAQRTIAGPIHTEKAIIFSQWTSALTLVQERLKIEGIKFERVDGSMKTPLRQAALDHFASDPEIKVLLLSLKAGNCGLNIVAANHVILLDPWWNPTVEDQAVDRVHRIGQTRPVTVVRLIIKDSIEELIRRLQDKKRAMYTSIFSPEEKEPRKQPNKSQESRGDIDFLLGRQFS